MFALENTVIGVRLQSLDNSLAASFQQLIVLLEMFVSDAPTASQWASLDTSDHSSHRWTILIVNGLFLGLVAVVILLRIVTKISTATRLFLDDCKPGIESPVPSARASFD